MDEKTGKQGSQAKTDQEHIPKEPKNPRGGKGISRVSLALFCAGSFTFLSSWAGLLGNLGRKFWIFAAIVMLLATVVAALGLKVELRNNHWLKWQYNGIAFIIVVFGFSMGVPVIVREVFRSEPRPHFKLILNTADSPDANLELTNSFFFPKQSVPLEISKIEGYLIVPVTSGRSNATLQFSVINDSGVAAEGTQFLVFIDNNLKCSPAIGWESLEPTIKSSWWVQDFGFRMHSLLLPNDWERLPDLNFTQITHGTNVASASAITLEIRAKEMPSIGLACRVVFVATSAPAKPFTSSVRAITKLDTNLFRVPVPDDVRRK